MNDDTKLVLLFNTRANPARAARVHAPTCAMVNVGGRGRHIVTKTEGTLGELRADIDDLNERIFPVRFCKCTKAL